MVKIHRTQTARISQNPMQNSNNPQSNIPILKRAGGRVTLLLLASLFAAFLETAQAGPYYWDPAQNPTGPSDGSGNWDGTTVSNWIDGTTLKFNVSANWPSVGTNVVIGAGVPGTYDITNINTVNAMTLTFSNANGYTISGNALAINLNVQSSPGIICLANTTNTIAAAYDTVNGAAISNGPNSQITFTGGGSSGGGLPIFTASSPTTSLTVLSGSAVGTQMTYNLGGGTATFNSQLTITNAIVNAGSRNDFGRSVGGTTAGIVNVLNGGQLNQNTAGGSGTDTGRHLQLSRGEPATLNVYPGGLVDTLIWIATPTPNNPINGRIRFVPDSGSQGTLNVLGGTVLVGDGPNTYGTPGLYSIALTPITYFDTTPTANANTRAVLNMTAGSITAFEIAFTQPGSLATANPTNGINITGGALYLAAPNISYPSGGMGNNFFFNLSGGTVAAIQNWSPACAAPINLTNVNGNITFQTADINGSPFNMAFSGPLTGSGGFNLIGSGTLTLSGANNYSGATVVSNGALVVSTLNSPQSGAVTLEGGSLASGLPTNSVKIASAGESWTLGGDLTYDTGTPTADFNYGDFAPSTTVPAIHVNGNIAFNATPQVTVEGSSIPDGVYPLIQYTGTLSGTAPTSVTLSNIYSGYISNNPAGKTIVLVVTNSTVPNGFGWAVGSGSWDLVSKNWNLGGVLTNYTDPDAVFFNDTASGPFPIVVAVGNNLTVNPSSILVASTNSYTIAGPGVVGGATTLVKSGTGTLTLSGTNTYSGGTVVNIGGGTLNINYGGDGVANSAIGTGPLTLNTGAQLGNSSGGPITLLTPITQYWNDDWTFVGANNLSLGVAPVTLGSAQISLTVVTNTLEVDGQITDNGSGYGIQKLGNGTLILSNLNTFSGGVDIVAGTVNINADGAVGNGLLTLEGGTIDNTSGSALMLNTIPSEIDVKGANIFLGTTNLDLGAPPVNILGNPTLTVSNNNLTLEGAIIGSNTQLTKNGLGSLTIAGSVSSSGTLFSVNQGVIYANRAPGFNSFTSQGVSIASNAAVVILTPTGTQFKNTELTLNGGLLELNGSSETIGSSTLNSGIVRNSGSAAVVTLQDNSTTTATWTLAGTVDFDVTNSSSLTLDGIVGGTATNALLLKTGLGALYLTNNTYAGNTTVSNGILSLAYPNLSTNSTVTIAGSGVLDLSFTNTTATTNIIAALIVNGVSQPGGVYNSNTVSYITSGGSLLVVPPAAPINPNPGTILFSVSGSVLNLGWPTNAGWLLQGETNPPGVGINSSNWVTVQGSASVTNMSVTISPTNGPTFFRMMYP